jgi:predicted secreted hydrolase
LAGAQVAPFKVWVEDWSSTGTGAEPGRVRLLAADGPVGVDLLLSPAKPAARHGRDGFSPKGTESGNASFYYSFTDLGATGTLTTATGSHLVEGKAWMDHEWSTSALAEGQTGWDWFALQLEGGRELMLYQIREADGSSAPTTSGSLVAPDGRVTPLERADFEQVATGTWTSPRTGGVYPSGWRVRVPGAGLDLTVTPLAEDQELATSLRYWEGAVRVTGTADDQPTTGYGYVELTGYAGAQQGGALPGLP